VSAPTDLSNSNTLDTMPINWYLQSELRLTTLDWYIMTQKFVATFSFKSQYPSIDQSLQDVRQKVFKKAPNLPIEQEEDEWTEPLQKLQGYYNINTNEDDDPRNVNIAET
jgi:cobalamin-dependent methionine synthase I